VTDRPVGPAAGPPEGPATDAAGTAAPRTWRDSAGAWLGLGAAPGALVLGAQIGGRHGGDLPVYALVAGGATMALLLAAQGLLGLRPPTGENAPLSELTPRYLPRGADRIVTVLLAMAMAGWFGFNVGLGGSAVAALSGLSDPVGVVLLGVPIACVLLAGGGRWNAVAVVTTLSAIALIAIVAVRLPPPHPVVTTGYGGTGRFVADIAGYIGYVAVFAVRAPDFTVGLGGRRDLTWCVGLLVGPALAASVVGAGLTAASGSTDVVAVLAGRDGLPVANLFVAASVVAPTLTTMHSGALAVRRFGRVSRRAAVLTIAVPGVALALIRMDRLMLGWLALLAAVLPALVLPMGFEAARRRRGRAPRPVPTWTWAPASALALALTLAGRPAAAIAGLAGAAAGTAIHAYAVARVGRTARARTG
jgi:purine-cytosine permease-like protein